MAKVKCIATEVVCVPNYPAFQPGEVRECTEEEQVYFLNNPNFVDPDVMDADLSETKKAKTGSDDGDDEDQEEGFGGRKNKRH